MSKLEKYRKSIIVVSFIIVVLVVGTISGIEVYLRQTDPQTNHYLYENRNGVIGLKSNLNTPYSVVPWKLKKAQPLPPTIKLITNAAGQRDTKNHAFKKANNTFRIVNLGNSIGLGYPLNLNATYLTRLEQSIPNAEAINCSLLGAGAVQLANLYEKECSQYDVDVVIVQLTTSEGSRQSNSLHSDFLSPNFLLDRMERLDSSALAGSYLYDHFNIVRYLVNPHLKKVSIQIKPLQKIVPPPPARLEMLRNHTHPTLQALLAIKKIVQNKNAKFLVLVTPPSHPLRQNVADPETTAFLAALNEINIEVVNFGQFLNSAGPLASDYYTGWFLNEKAHEAIAKILKEKIFKEADGVTLKHQEKKEQR